MSVLLPDDGDGDLRARLERLERRFYGKYQAFLVDNADPQKRGRLRLQIPEVLGPDVVSGWAEPCFPYGGGPDYGSFHIPPLCKSSDGKVFTTGVWVEFRGGQPQFPIWVGTFFGAPSDTSEAPGDDAAPDVDVHVFRTFAGHGVVAVDKAGSERFEIRDAAGQKLKFAAPLKANAKRSAEGKKTTATTAVDYPNLADDSSASVTLTDVAGNSIVLDAAKAAPVVTITNKTRDGSVKQTIVMSGASGDAKITITDKNNNVVTLSKEGIQLTALGTGPTVTMKSSGIEEKGQKINLNDGSQGAARKLDKIQSGMPDDPAYWSWINELVIWLNTHTHTAPPMSGATLVPMVPFEAPAPSTLTGHITTASGTVVIGG